MTRVGARAGFTLIELLIVIAIIGALIAMLLPAIQKVREAAGRAQCQNNLKQVALGLHNYHSTYECFPPGTGILSDPWYGPWSGPSIRSCFVALLPYLEQGNLYNALYAPNGTDAGGPSTPGAQSINSLVCPSDVLPNPAVYKNSFGNYFGLTSYGVNVGTQFPVTIPTPLLKDGIFHYNTQVRVTDVTDGTSSTILAGERSHYEPLWTAFWSKRAKAAFIYQGAWIQQGDTFTWRRAIERINYRLPASVASSPPPVNGFVWNDMYYKRLNVYGSQHPGGCNLAFADGSIRFVSENIDLTALIYLSTRADGEVIASDY